MFVGVGLKEIFFVAVHNLIFVDCSERLPCKQNEEDGENNKRGDSARDSLVVLILVVAEELAGGKEVE